MFLYLFLFIFQYKIIQTQKISFDTIVCFGDSNTDYGNVYSLTNFTWPIVPPYYQGRFSDGPIWFEQLGVLNLINHAYGSATTDNNVIMGYTGANSTILVPGVRQQIQVYRNRTDLTKINFHKTAYFIWAGANDYFFNFSLSPHQVVESLMRCIKDLIGFGALNIFVMNQPPIDKQPVSNYLNQSEQIKLLITAHNQNLSSSMKLLTNMTSKIRLELLDLHSIIQNIIDNMSSNGINTMNPAWLINGTQIIKLSNTTNNYLHLDNFHYTTRIHQMISDQIRSSIITSSSEHSVSINHMFFIFYFLNFFFNTKF